MSFFSTFKYHLCLLFTAVFITGGPAAAQQVAPFKNGDRVVFMGNSITDGGHYHSYIWLYYMTHFPLKDTIEVKKENLQIRNALAKLMPGLAENNKYRLEADIRCGGHHDGKIHVRLCPPIPKNQVLFIIAPHCIKTKDPQQKG